MIYFCGYPVDGKPCGKPATPGCAFCDEHGQAFENTESCAPVNTSEKFGVADSLAMDTGHGPDKTVFDLPGLERQFDPLLTEQDIVNRATERRWRWYWRVSWCFPVAILLLWVVALYPHSWTVYLRAHVEFLWGLLAGSLLQVPGWLRDRWRWLKWFSV